MRHVSSSTIKNVSYHPLGGARPTGRGTTRKEEEGGAREEQGHRPLQDASMCNFPCITSCIYTLPLHYL